MSSDNQTYWHIQMHLPDGKNGARIDSMPMLQEAQPVIGITEWEDKQCEDFKRIPEGSIVLVRDGNKALALCKIIGPNYTSEKLQAKYHNINYRNVEILGFIPEEDQPDPNVFSQGTFRCCKPDPNKQQWPYIHQLYTRMTKQAKITDTLEQQVQLLKDKKNIILQGAPGTGKTYTTASLAVRLCNPSFTELEDHAKVMEEYEYLREEGQIAFCTFHQSMDYEDFVEGLKPEVQHGNVTYEVQSGIFKQICERAHTTEGDTSTKPHVLIIDEINRGNISRIFGELITLLEADKRTGGGAHPIKVTLPYSKESFSVPSSLYIIGTMNTTDRSTGAIDYAVRRRFAFITLEANREVVERSIQDKDVRTKALALFDEINGKGAEDKTSFIATHQAGDFDLEDLKVGHSYFIAKDLPELQRKMRYEVIPLLREYIKDGILQAKEGDGEYFSAWEQGECRGPKQAVVSKDPSENKV